MKNQEIYEGLLQALYISYKNYNEKPNYFTEDALFFNVDGFNRFVKANKMPQILWTREDNSNSYKQFVVFYIPFIRPKD